MATILYGVAGEGNGHAIRAKTIIDELKKQHTVLVFSYGKNYTILKKTFSVQRILGFYMYYFNNTVSATVTSLINIILLPFILLVSLRYIPHFLKKPDVVITDFEPFVSYWAKMFNIPVISIDNQHAITHTSIDHIKEQKLYELYSKLVVHVFVPTPKHIIITTFFDAKTTTQHATTVPPIIKQETINKKTTNKKYILVYQTSASYTKMLPVLKKINKNFIIYGFNKNLKENNLTFKKFNHDFNKDIAAADAVIINGGFTTLTEALYLQKPIFSIPIKQQFEQILNGHYINKLNYGMAVKDITLENFTGFLENKEQYRENIKKIQWDNNKEFFAVLNRIIKKLTRHKTLTFIKK